MVRPKVIQHVSSTNASFWLMNNGEVYSSGDNSTYDLGHHIAVTNTTDRYYPNRVSADDTVDWLGETIRTFNETKIVKIGTSGQGQNSEGNTQYALGEDGSVWIWGRNNQHNLVAVILVLTTQLILTVVHLTHLLSIQQT